jgi:ribonucleotide monophosphatase NagD (HAD superfamily)
MIGDDVEADIAGAAAFGLKTVLVRTGKFRQEVLDEATVKPNGVIDSIAALPDWLESAS